MTLKIRIAVVLTFKAKQTNKGLDFFMHSKLELRRLRLLLVDIFCDDYSGTFTFQMHSYFFSFLTDQDVPPATKVYVPEPDFL